MNFKVVTFKCGCKYVFTEAMPRQRKCIECNQFQESVTLWCAKCNKKLIVTPAAGRRQYCLACGTYQAKKSSILWEQKRDNEEPTGLTKHEKDESAMKVWFSELQDKFKPPILEII